MRAFLRLSLFVVVAAVSSGARAQAPRVKAVASFSILADFVREIGGARVEVSSLVGPDADAHEFQPSPADARTLSDARLVVVNGLGLDGWIDRLVSASGTKAAVVVASAGVSAIKADEGAGHDRGGANGRTRIDPHAWQSIANAKIYVANIRDALIRVDPDGAAAYGSSATRYLGELDRLDAEAKAAMAAIPPARLVIITTHDAFGYFAAAYGMKFVAPQGVSTESEATARDVGRIIRQIRANKIPAVFLENVSDPRLMTRIAEEGGARIGRKVYSDALSGPGGPAATYLAMMRNNIAAFRDALAP